MDTTSSSSDASSWISDLAFSGVIDASIERHETPFALFIHNDIRDEQHTSHKSVKTRHALERLEVVGLERLDVLPPELLRVHDAPPQLAGVHLRHVPLERAVLWGRLGGEGEDRSRQTVVYMRAPVAQGSF